MVSRWVNGEIIRKGLGEGAELKGTSELFDKGGEVVGRNYQAEGTAGVQKALNTTKKGLPGGLVAKTLHSQFREAKFDPWSGN